MSDGLDNINSKYQFDFSQETQAIYHEYFDAKSYIIEQAIIQNLPKMSSISEFVGWYLQFVHREREFYLKFFGEESL